MSVNSYNNPVSFVANNYDYSYPIIFAGAPTTTDISGKVWLFLSHVPLYEYAGYNFENRDIIPVSFSISTVTGTGYIESNSYRWKNIVGIDIDTIDGLSNIYNSEQELFVSVKYAVSSSVGVRTYDELELNAGKIKVVDWDKFNGTKQDGKYIVSVACYVPAPSSVTPPDEITNVNITFSGSGTYGGTTFSVDSTNETKLLATIRDDQFGDEPDDVFADEVIIKGSLKQRQFIGGVTTFVYIEITVYVLSIIDLELEYRENVFLPSEVFSAGNYGSGANKSTPYGLTLSEQLIFCTKHWYRDAFSSNLIGTQFPAMFPEVLFFRIGINELEYCIGGSDNITTWADATREYTLHESKFRNYYRVNREQQNLLPTRTREHRPYEDQYDGFQYQKENTVNPDYISNNRASFNLFFSPLHYYIDAENYRNAIDIVTGGINGLGGCQHSLRKDYKNFVVYGSNDRIETVINTELADEANTPEGLKITYDVGLPAVNTNGSMRYSYINDCFRSFFNLLDLQGFNCIEDNGDGTIKFYYPKYERTADFNNIFGFRSSTESANNELYALDKMPPEDGGIDINVYKFNIRMNIEYTTTYTSATQTCNVTFDTLEYVSNDFANLLGTNPSVVVLMNMTSTAHCFGNQFRNVTYRGSYLIEKTESETWEEFCERLGKLAVQANNNLTVVDVDNNGGTDCFGNTPCSHVYEGDQNLQDGYEFYVVFQKRNSTEMVEGTHYINYEAENFPKWEDMSDDTFDPTDDTSYNWVWNNFCAGPKGETMHIGSTQYGRRGWVQWLRIMSSVFFSNPQFRTPLIMPYKNSEFAFYKFFSTDKERFDAIVDYDATTKYQAELGNLTGVFFPGYDVGSGGNCTCNYKFLYPLLQVMGGRSEQIPGFAPYGHDRNYDECWNFSNRKLNIFNSNFSYTYGGLTMYDCFVYSRDVLYNQRVPISTMYLEQKNDEGQEPTNLD